MAIGIFSAFILYDVQRIVNGGETNYITATLSIYLDVYNIFTSLLSLLGLVAAAATDCCAANEKADPRVGFFIRHDVQTSTFAEQATLGLMTRRGQYAAAVRRRPSIRRGRCAGTC